MKICGWVMLIWLFSSLMNVHAGSDSWNTLKGTNFIVKYRPDVPEDYAQTVLDAAEEEFVRVSRNLGITRYQNWRFDNRATITIYSDPQDYTTNGKQYHWSGGASLAQEKMIITYPQANGFFDSTLPHELGHIIFRELVGINIVVPLWFQEGIAMHQERAKQVGVNKIVRSSIEKGTFIPLTDLSDMRLYKIDDAKVQLFYAEAASCFEFLVNTYGEQKLRQLLRELKDNTPFETALGRVYFRLQHIDDLNKLWVKFLKGEG